MKLIQTISLAIIIALTFVSGVFAQEIKLGDLTIQHMFIRPNPPKAPVSAGYMIIKNTGSSSDWLIGGAVSFAKKVEVHEMKMDGEIMKMRQLVGGLEIPAGGEVTLKPGGFHIMFMKLSEQMKIGDKHMVKLIFKNAGEVDIEFDVKKPMKH